MPLYNYQYTMFNLIIALAIAWTVYTNTNHYNEQHCTDDGCPSWHENQGYDQN